MASQQSFLPAIEKLIGRENFTKWKFSVQAYLEHEQLWACITGEERMDGEKLTKAKSKLILLIKPENCMHIQNCTTAKAIWDKLKGIFDDSGLSRRVSLIRTIATTKLDDCSNMEDYVQLIMNTAHKLNEINVALNDEWIGVFMLAGLPDSYKPMIMALENSGIQISADAIKTKLLQEYKPAEKSDSSKAFYTSKKQLNKKKGGKNWYKKSSEPSTSHSQIQCFICSQYGHKSFECPERKKKHNDTSTKNVNNSRKGAFVVCLGQF